MKSLKNALLALAVLYASASLCLAADSATMQAAVVAGATIRIQTLPRPSAAAGQLLVAVNFAGETAGVIGLSYLFHKTGHHRLERVTPMLDIGASGFAVIYDLNHR